MAIVPSNVSSNHDVKGSASKKKPSKETSNKPKRPLSAYNLFFKAERERILKNIKQPSHKPRRSHGKIGFADLARNVAERWKSLDALERRRFEELATQDKDRYEREVEAWNQARVKKLTVKSEQATNAKCGHVEPFDLTPLPIDNNFNGMFIMNDMHDFPSQRSAFSFSDSSSCSESEDGDAADSISHTKALLKAAVNICSQRSLKSSITLMDCTPLPVTTDGDSSLASLVSCFDEECFDIMKTLKSL
jgi:hypothetical protein